MFDNHKYFMAKPKHLARVAANLTECVNWILITGGEPTLYPLDPLVDELHNRHCMVALETNGTSMRYHTANIDWLTVSPKLSVEGPPVLLEVVATADELIFVITCEQDIQRVIDYLNTFTDMFILGQVCLQPADNNSELTVLCTDAVIRCNWRLSIQTMQLLKERSSE
jgi:organic radical activating enzyme